MPIRDTDFLTATMVIRALEKKLFDRESTARLCEARSDDEVLRLLAESGYEAGSSLSGLEPALAASRKQLFDMLAEWLPEGTSAILDVFRAPIDAHNIKVLIKAEASGEDVSSLMLDMGRFSAAELTEQMRESSFARLHGALGEAAREAREALARTGDPQLSDFLLDKACLSEMLTLAKNSESDFLLGYVRLYHDVYNLRSIVRATRIGKGPDFLRLILSAGGSVDVSRLAASLQSGSPVEEVFANGPLAEAAEAGGPASRGEGSLTVFEKLCDDALLRYAKIARTVAFGEAPLIGYYLEREAEMTMLRTVVGGRSGGVPAGQIRERLRAAYV